MDHPTDNYKRSPDSEPVKNILYRKPPPYQLPGTPYLPTAPHTFHVSAPQPQHTTIPQTPKPQSSQIPLLTFTPPCPNSHLFSLPPPPYSQPSTPHNQPHQPSNHPSPSPFHPSIPPNQPHQPSYHPTPNPVYLSTPSSANKNLPKSHPSPNLVHLSTPSPASKNLPESYPSPPQYNTWHPIDILHIFNLTHSIPAMSSSHYMVQELLQIPLSPTLRLENDLRIAALEWWWEEQKIWMGTEVIDFGEEFEGEGGDDGGVDGEEGGRMEVGRINGEVVDRNGRTIECPPPRMMNGEEDGAKTPNRVWEVASPDLPRIRWEDAEVPWAMP